MPILADNDNARPPTMKRRDFVKFVLHVEADEAATAARAQAERDANVTYLCPRDVLVRRFPFRWTLSAMAAVHAMPPETCRTFAEWETMLDQVDAFMRELVRRPR